MKLALSIQTPEIKNPLPLTLLTGNIDEKIEKAAQLQVDGLEFVTIYPDLVDADAIRKLLENHNLKAAGIASGAMASVAGLTLLHSDPATAAEAIKRMEGLIRLAGKLEAPVVTIGSFRGRAGIDSEASRKHFIQILQRAGALAANLGVRLAIEPLNRYETDFLTTVRDVLEVLKEVDRPAVGVLIDTFHANIEESSRTGPFFEAAEAGKLFYVHIPDNNRLAPGWGMINYREIVSALDQVGYGGYLTAELFARPDPDSAAQQTVKFIRSLVPRAEPG